MTASGTKLGGTSGTAKNQLLAIYRADASGTANSHLVSAVYRKSFETNLSDSQKELTTNQLGGTYIFLFICYLHAAPILMTLAAGYPHRPWQFPRRGWLPVPDGMVFDERFFF